MTTGLTVIINSPLITSADKIVVTFFGTIMLLSKPKTYDHAKAAYNSHLQKVFAGAAQLQKWWASLKSLYGINSSMPPLCASDGLVYFDQLRS